MVIVQEGRPRPPVERLEAEADVVVVRTADEFRAAQPGAEILFLNDFRTKLLHEVGPGELLVVPRGVEHRTVAEEEAAVLIFEPAATRNTGNVADSQLTAPSGVRL